MTLLIVTSADYVRPLPTPCHSPGCTIAQQLADAFLNYDINEYLSQIPRNGPREAIHLGR